jgi:hypothetical protein
MTVPEGTTGVSFGGINYDIGADDTVDIPVQYVNDAMSHGLKLVAVVATDEESPHKKGKRVR